MSGVSDAGCGAVAFSVVEVEEVEEPITQRGCFVAGCGQEGYSYRQFACSVYLGVMYGEFGWRPSLPCEQVRSLGGGFLESCFGVDLRGGCSFNVWRG